jgi:hypothetical protein
MVFVSSTFPIVGIWKMIFETDPRLPRLLFRHQYKILPAMTEDV